MIRIIIKTSKTNIESNIELVSKIKSELVNNKIALDVLKKYGYTTDILDGISISFSDNIESSAKTTDGKIEINSSLLDEKFEIIMRYVVHELVHVLQHMKNDEPNDNNEEYLDQPDELEAFQYQIAYEDGELGRESAEDYIDELITYHELDDKDINEKKEELLNLIKD